MSTRQEQHRYHHGDLRAALLSAAEHSLRERGAAQLSLRDLAKEVGVSHAAPRRHFPERQDLLDALAEAGFDRLGERIRDTITDDDVSSQIRKASSAFAHFATENPSLLELMNTTKHRAEATNVARSSEAAYAPIVDLIRRGQSDGILHTGQPEDIGLILYATINGIVTLVNTGAIDADRLDEIIDTAVSQFLRGAAP